MRFAHARGVSLAEEDSEKWQPCLTTSATPPAASGRRRGSLVWGCDVKYDEGWPHLTTTSELRQLARRVRELETLLEEAALHLEGPRLLVDRIEEALGDHPAPRSAPPTPRLLGDPCSDCGGREYYCATCYEELLAARMLEARRPLGTSKALLAWEHVSDQRDRLLAAAKAVSEAEDVDGAIEAIKNRLDPLIKEIESKHLPEEAKE